MTASRAVLTRASVWCAQRELIFDKYHQSLYNTVVHLLAPGQSAAAEQAAWAAWNLISEVICVSARVRGVVCIAQLLVETRPRRVVSGGLRTLGVSRTWGVSPLRQSERH